MCASHPLSFSFWFVHLVLFFFKNLLVLLEREKESIELDGWRREEKRETERQGEWRKGQRVRGETEGQREGRQSS